MFLRLAICGVVWCACVWCADFFTTNDFGHLENYLSDFGSSAPSRLHHSVRVAIVTSMSDVHVHTYFWPTVTELIHYIDFTIAIIHIIRTQKAKRRAREKQMYEKWTRPPDYNVFEWQRVAVHSHLTVSFSCHLRLVLGQRSFFFYVFCFFLFFWLFAK